MEGVKVEYPIVEGKDCFYYDIEGMIKVYEEQKPKLVLISSPNNPTGNRLELDQMRYVLEKMKDTDGKARVIILTGDRSVMTSVLALEKGAFAFMDKPVDFVTSSDEWFRPVAITTRERWPAELAGISVADVRVWMEDGKSKSMGSH